MRKLIVTTFCAVGVLAAGSLSGQAQETLQKVDGFPQRPLTIIVPYGPGGGSDQLSRAMGAALEEVTGEGVQVVNKPGGGGLAAIPDFMTAPADGYTILESIDDAVTNYVSGKLDLHPGEDWWPICMAQITFSQIYIRPGDERFNNWKQFVAYARDHSGELSIANVGNRGSMERVNMLNIEKALGFKTKQIAFDKPAERYAALVGGHVDALFEQPGDVRSFLESDEMKPILTIYTERPSAFADVPTTAEVGVDAEPLLRFRGFWTRNETPKERRAYLEQACKKAFNTAGFEKFNRSKYMHLINAYRDHEGSVKLIKNSVETYRQVYKEIGIID